MTTMTQAQIQAFATDIENNTDQFIVDAVAKNESAPIQSWYNEVRSPDFWVWKNFISVMDQKDKAVDPEELTSRSLNEQNTFIFWLNGGGGFDPSERRNRRNIDTTFKANQTPKTHAGLFGIFPRLVTRVEHIFATDDSGSDSPFGGDGSAKNAVALAVYVGPCDRDDVEDALAIVNP